MARPEPQIPDGAALLARLARRETVTALGVRGARTPEIARIAAAAGYDVLWVDLEHSTMSVDAAAQICAAAHDLGIFPFVRTPEREHGVIGRLLDGGALGIIAPRIETAAEAKAIVSACRFPPAGLRSAMASLGSQGFETKQTDALFERANCQMLVKILIESERGIANLEAIAGVEGVDIVGIGSNDLAAEIGVPGQTMHARMRTLHDAALAAAERAGKPLVVGGIGDAAYLADVVRRGAATFLMAGIDTDLLLGAVRERVRQAHASLR